MEIMLNIFLTDNFQLISMLHVANCYALLFGINNGRDLTPFLFSVILYYSVWFIYYCFPFLPSSEIGWCVALLEDSVSILLGCLESTDLKMINVAGYFAWNMEEALKCASFFRRIYEEVIDDYAFFYLKLYKYHFDCGTCLGCVFPYGLLYPFFSVALWVYKLLKYFASFLLKRAHANSRLCTKY